MARIEHHHSPPHRTASSAVTVFVRNEGGRILLIGRFNNDLYAIPVSISVAGRRRSDAHCTR
jgi:hypothetical protein